MPTQWIPATRPFPKSWVLGNGDVVHEPPLEVTSTHLKTRVVGETSSRFTKDLDVLLNETITRIAETRKTNVWLDTQFPLSEQITKAVGFDADQVRPKIHIFESDTNTTRLWWRFKDAATTFEVLVILVVQGNSSYTNSVAQHLSLSMGVPVLNQQTLVPTVTRVHDDTFHQMRDAAGLNMDQHQTWRQFLHETPGDIGHILTAERAPHPRAAVEQILTLVRKMDSLASIDVPDFSDLDAPSYRTLDFDSSNVNGQVITNLVEYLNESTMTEQAAEHYSLMLKQLKLSGVQVEAKSSNDFLSALLAGDEDVLNMRVKNPAGHDDTLDDDHSVWVHLPTGSLVVECSHQGVDHDEVAHAWEEAKTVASLTGEEDLLMAYARAYVAEAQKERSRKILKQRRGQ